MAHASDIQLGYERSADTVFSIVRNLGLAFLRSPAGAARLRLVEHLQAKSDGDLAALGIRRKDIYRYVFDDVIERG